MISQPRLVIDKYLLLIFLEFKPIIKKIIYDN